MTLITLTEELDKLNQQDTEGELILRNDEVVWHLHISHGKLLYAKDKLHPVRRWDRALKQHCPKWNWSSDSSQLSNNNFWECELLLQGLEQNKLSLIQAKLVIRNVVQECLFELINCTDTNSDWQPGEQDGSTLCRSVALSNREIQVLLSRATRMQQQWQAAQLNHLSLTLAPSLQQKQNLQELPLSDNYLNGEFTLWDIAWQLEKSVTEVTSSLLPLVEQGIVQFQETTDTPAPIVKQPVVPTIKQSFAATRSLSTTPLQSLKSTHQKPLIACIDDSPVLAHSLRKILIPAGYHMLSIQEPMRGFTQLIEHKPDLILLDLLLPNADGYSICKFLRDTPVFKDTPIIILTARNTKIDRARAKIVGATEFLGKPPEPQELLQTIHKYLTLSINPSTSQVV
ncbi:MAG: response regulator [Symploca sp. SIO2C1]|nr:response regulator [Symploca sp. SIO2C1]